MINESVFTIGRWLAFASSGGAFGAEAPAGLDGAGAEMCGIDVGEVSAGALAGIAGSSASTIGAAMEDGEPAEDETIQWLSDAHRLQHSSLCIIHRVARIGSVVVRC